MDPRAAQRIAVAFRNRKDSSTLSPAEFNRELDKVRELRTKLVDTMIDAGRGDERPSDTAQYPFGRDDPLTLAVLAVSGRYLELQMEMRRRWGPGILPHHLPRSASPIRLREGQSIQDDAILQAIYDLGDVDYAAGFDRATTEELAAYFGIDPGAMLRRMQQLARAGQVYRSRDTLSRSGRKRVGWQSWEITWDPATDPYAKPFA